MFTKLKHALLMLFVLALAGSAAAASQATDSISVTLCQKKVRRGEKVSITIEARQSDRSSTETVHALLLRPTVGTEELTLHASAESPGLYHAEVTPGKDAPEGLYVVHSWTGEKSHPSAVGKASFLLGRLTTDFFIVSYVDQERPAEDIADYMRDFRSIGGNFLVAHNLINTSKAFYPSKISKTDVQPGSPRDIVELTLDRADREGYAVLLSVGWDMTRQSPYKDRMKEIKAITSELYGLYKHHPSLAGFYSWQEGSGTYYAPFVKEFSQYVKSLGPNILTACAPHIDDPLLAGYLSTIDELDILIYQAGVMASYRPDNRKLYPPRRVRDFCSLGAGAKRLQDKIAIPHVEMFAYLEKKQAPDILAAPYEDIYRQILSAATVTDTDGISLFSYHAHIHLPMRKYKQVERSRNATIDALKAYRLITAEISRARNPVAVYFPYSDWIVERWPNYFLPALDAFRTLGVPVDILPYAPALDESAYPYYPINMNTDVLRRLLRERTVLVLPNVSGFQQTDGDLIKAFVEQGGTIVAFGPQIPMARTYERKELFGGDEAQGVRTHTSVIVKEGIGQRVKAGRRFAFSRVQLPAWTTNGARTIATFEDGSPAVTLNQFGKGQVFAVIPDARTAVVTMPDLVRDVIERALIGGKTLPVDIVGSNENTDIAVERTPGGFRVAVINYSSGEMDLILRPTSPASGVFEWIDLVRNNKTKSQAKDQSLQLNVPGSGFRALEFRQLSAN